MHRYSPIFFATSLFPSHRNSRLQCESDSCSCFFARDSAPLSNLHTSINIAASFSKVKGDAQHCVPVSDTGSKCIYIAYSLNKWDFIGYGSLDFGNQHSLWHRIYSITRYTMARFKQGYSSNGCIGSTLTHELNKSFEIVSIYLDCCRQIWLYNLKRPQND